ncbi:hypothetical protein [Catenulispora rubra]|uniref:hypothetical protein n=1 Tax=Catenulispora rubra TaxID=280293 RepID=UPI001891F9D0|nr:hypothetical protein [Catenulispora rubra]
MQRLVGLRVPVDQAGRDGALMAFVTSEQDRERGAGRGVVGEQRTCWRSLEAGGAAAESAGVVSTAGSTGRRRPSGRGTLARED